MALPQEQIELDTQIQNQKLLQTARQCLQNSYSPYSGFAVAAALVTADGAVFTGVNVENSNFTGTICAERSAFVSAIAAGHKRFATVAIVSAKAHYCWPCGQCRQFMYEFGDRLQVVVEGKDGVAVSTELAALLPMSDNSA